MVEDVMGDVEEVVKVVAAVEMSAVVAVEEVDLSL